MEEEKNTKDLSLKNRIIINVSVFGFIVLAIVFFVVVPALRDIGNIRTAIDSQRMDLEQKYQRGQNLKKVGEKLRNVKPRVKELDSVFADKSKNLEFVTMLEKVADKRNVSQRINLGSFPKIPKGVYENNKMELMVSGDFSDVMGYLVDLETLPYYINVDSVKLNSGLGGLESRKDQIKSPVTLILTTEVNWRNESLVEIAPADGGDTQKKNESKDVEIKKEDE